MFSNNKGPSNRATVRPFIKHSSSTVPVPPSTLNGIFNCHFDDCEDDDNEISASQLIRDSNFKIPSAPQGILKGPSRHADLPDPVADTVFGSQASGHGFFGDIGHFGFPKPKPSPFYDDENEDLFYSSLQSLPRSQHLQSGQNTSMEDSDVIPSSQPTRHGPRFIPSFTPKRVRITEDASCQMRSKPRQGDHGRLSTNELPVDGETPYSALDVPEFTTPGGTTRGGNKLRSVNEIPGRYRCTFPFPYFNIMQSKVLDDVLYSENHLVICAPTGSGKTVIFELAIVHLLIAMGANAVQPKIVYMAPIKALCSQRCQDWKDKFGPLGLKCQELTGDTEVDDYFQLQEVNIVMTTPEKWDSMTRKWRDNKSLVQLVKLFLIDEVHSLGEEQRGATVEAVISRMKTVQAALTREASSSINNESTGDAKHQGFRFLAVSATIPNIEDVAAWLETGGKQAVYHKLDESHRPVQLRKVVLSYPCSKRQSEFRFDLSLNYRLSGVIHTYSDQKPTLVFCATRKGVQQAASTLVKEARFIMGGSHRQRLQKTTSMIRDTKLRELLLNGVGFHHAGLDAQDRKYIEEMFINGDLPVLFATSTLAMGVNLPAHLVIVKSTQHYVSGVFCEYTETQVLQMIGRAGRPQFDTSATAVIMTKHETKSKYEALLSGCDDIESSLHNHLIEHLNAEIVLHTISDVSVALEWLKSTFLYIRMMKNPTHYGIPAGLSSEQIETKLQDMCIRDLNLLSDFGLIKMDPETMDLKPMEAGRMMARYCIAFDSMKRFSKISGTESLEELISMLCQCQEFADIQLRVNERKVLNTLNTDKNRVTIRYPMKGKIKTTAMKVNCLMQATMGCLPIQDFGLTQDCTRIFRAGQRITRCLLEFLTQRTDFQVLLAATVLSKCFKARLWENSKYVARQLDRIGPALGTALVNAGMINFSKLENTNPREMELILNRHPPFGNQIVEAVSHLPKYDVSIEQVPRYSPQSAEVTVTVSLINKGTLTEKQTARSNHGCLLLIGDTDNRITFKQRIMDMQLLRAGTWCKRVDVRRASKGAELSINLISQDYVGLDVQNAYTPFYSGPKRPTAAITESAYYQPMASRPVQQSNDSSQGLKRRCTQLASFTQGVDPYLLGRDRDVKSSESELSDCGDRIPCSHRCTHKETCAHDCCKVGVAIRRPTATSRPDKQGIRAPSGCPAKPLASTPKAPRLSRLDQYFQDLHSKTQGLPQVSKIKRMKQSQEQNSVDLNKFAFVPSTRPVIQATPSSPPTSLSSTASLTASKPLPSTPFTPSVATGWEMLDMYQQTRCLDPVPIITDVKEADCTSTQIEEVGGTEEPLSTWADERWTNIEKDLSWSDSELEESIVDKYVADNNNDDCEEQQQDEPAPSLHRSEQVLHLTTQQCYNQPQQAPCTTAPAAPAHMQQCRLQQAPPSMPCTGQAFAWTPTVARPLPVRADAFQVPKPPLNRCSSLPWSSAAQATSRQEALRSTVSQPFDFVSARSVMDKRPSTMGTPLPRPCAVNQSFQANTQDQPHPSNVKAVIQQNTSQGLGELEVCDESPSVIVISDEEGCLDSSNVYAMNSSSDDELLNSVLEVESMEAEKMKGRPAESSNSSRAFLAAPMSPEILDSFPRASKQGPSGGTIPQTSSAVNCNRHRFQDYDHGNSKVSDKSTPLSYPSLKHNPKDLRNPFSSKFPENHRRSAGQVSDGDFQAGPKSLPLTSLTAMGPTKTSRPSKDDSLKTVCRQKPSSSAVGFPTSPIFLSDTPKSSPVFKILNIPPNTNQDVELPAASVNASLSGVKPKSSPVFKTLNLPPNTNQDLELPATSAASVNASLSGVKPKSSPVFKTLNLPPNTNQDLELPAASVNASLSLGVNSQAISSPTIHSPNPTQSSPVPMKASHSMVPSKDCGDVQELRSPKPLHGVSLHSSPAASQRGSLPATHACSPLLRRQQIKNFFTNAPDKSPETADEAQATLDRMLQGLF